MTQQERERKKKEKKKRQSIIEAEIYAVVQRSLKTAVDTALADIFKDWK